MATKLQTLKPRVQTQASRVPVSTGSWRTEGMTSGERGYTYRWQRERKGWLRAHPLCGDRINGPSLEHSACLRSGRVTIATDVDHIEPHRGNAVLMWDRGNWQSLCHACHSAKTQREDG